MYLKPYIFSSRDKLLNIKVLNDSIDFKKR